MVAEGKGKLSVDYIYKMDVAPRDKVDLKKKGGGGVRSSVISSAIQVRRICRLID